MNSTLPSNVIDPVLLAISPVQEPVPQASEKPVENFVGHSSTSFSQATTDALNLEGRKADPSARSLSQTGRDVERVSPAGCSTDTYAKMTVAKLKDICRSRSLPVGGNKPQLLARLKGYDVQNLSTVTLPTPRSRGPAIMSSTAFSPAEVSTPEIGIDFARADEDAGAIDRAFNRVLGGSEVDEVMDELDDEDAGGGASSESDAEDCMQVDAPGGSVNAATNVWVDDYILASRRKSGKQTENSVLGLWKKWLVTALANGTVPDEIIDAYHITQYLQYVATRKLLTTRGHDRSGSRRLSPASLKKIMTMLGRVRRRQEDDNPTLAQTRPATTSRTADFYKALMIESQRMRLEEDDFDVTRDTIIDTQILPHHFEQITKAILHMDQVPSIIKSHFSWTWQCTTLNRGDEILNLLLCCLQPHRIFISHFNMVDGRRSGRGDWYFGVLSLYHETKVAKPRKQEPDYNFVLPHRDPSHCTIGALAILLYYIFDKENIVGTVDGWDWSRAATWRKVKLLFGRKVGVPASNDGMRKMYMSFLNKTNIKSNKKLHLARKTMPEVMEDMGVNMDEIDGIGHWTGNTRREVYSGKIPKAAVTALAGFFVGEQYQVPWASVPVPDELCLQLYPFTEAALANLRSGSVLNHGIINFLELLQQLRPFFWRVLAAIHTQFPDSPLLQRLPILNSESARQFFTAWPELRRAQEAVAQSRVEQSAAFSEAATQGAFMSMHTRQDGVEQVLRAQSRQLEVLVRRTQQLSPSKRKASTASLSTPSISPPRTPAIGDPFISTPTTTRDSALTVSGSSSSSHLISLSSLPTSASTLSELSVVPRSELPLGHSGASEEACAENEQKNTFEATPAASTIIVHPSACITPPSLHAHPLLTPFLLVHGHVRYAILRLSPGYNPPATPHDMILPDPAAFCNPGDSSARYPAFTTANCSWSSILALVRQPKFLWYAYGPGNLGKYSNIEDLWRVWNEGAKVEGVGRKPPLRDIEKEWGSQKNRVTKKGRLQSWRPRTDVNVRQQWSLFHFFISRIDTAMEAGKTASEAMVELEELRGSHSLNQLHRSLQPKKKSNPSRMVPNEADPPTSPPDRPTPPSNGPASGSLTSPAAISRPFPVAFANVVAGSSGSGVGLQLPVGL